MGKEGNTEGHGALLSVKRNLHHETGLGRGHRKPIDMASITSGNVEDLYCYFLNRKMGFCSLKSCKHFQGCNAVVAPTDYASGDLKKPNAASKSPAVSERKNFMKRREVKK